MRRVISSLVSFLPSQMRPEIRELYLSTMIMNFGLALVMIFEPIYLYTIGYSIQYILLFFLIVYVAYFLLMPFGAHFAREFGYEHSIFVSTLLFIGYYVVFYNIASYPWFFVLAAVLYALQKTFYWPSYHADFARYANRTEDAREVGGLESLILVVNIIAPLIGGLILEFFGFATLFVCVSIILLVSNMPLLLTREVFVPKGFPYLLAYRNLISKENRRKLIGYIGYGEELVALVVWPVFMIAVVRDYLKLGSIISVAALITALFTLYVSRRSDLRSKRTMLRTGVFVYALIWIQRALVRAPFGVFTAEALGRLGKEMISVPIVSLTYEDAKNMSVMQTVMLFEMSLVVGKLIALALALSFFLFIPGYLIFQALFILAGLMTLLYLVRSYV